MSNRRITFVPTYVQQMENICKYVEHILTIILAYRRITFVSSYAQHVQYVFLCDQFMYYVYMCVQHMQYAYKCVVQAMYYKYTPTYHMYTPTRVANLCTTSMHLRTTSIHLRTRKYLVFKLPLNERSLDERSSAPLYMKVNKEYERTTFLVQTLRLLPNRMLNLSRRLLCQQELCFYPSKRRMLKFK